MYLVHALKAPYFQYFQQFTKSGVITHVVYVKIKKTTNQNRSKSEFFGKRHNSYETKNTVNVTWIKLSRPKLKVSRNVFVLRLVELLIMI